MALKERRARHRWWRRRKTQRRLAMAASFVVAVGVLAWFVIQSAGNSEPEVYLTEPAPLFTLPTVAGDEFSLREHRGQHNILLFFNEGLGCAPCLDQVVDLDEKWESFDALDVKLVSIMVDPMDALAAEAHDRGMTSIVASDEDRNVSTAYDALEFSMHPGIRPGHSFMLVNKSGRMIWRWDWIGHGQPMYVEVDDIYEDVAKRLEALG